MDQQLYLKFLKEYTLEALENSENNVSQAADYLERKSKFSFFIKNNREKNSALRRVKKVFGDSRERSLYVVLKSLGFDALAKENL